MIADRAKTAVEAVLENDGRLAKVTVETAASPVGVSPSEAVFVFLTADRDAGPFILVSDAEDVGDPEGFYVGAFFEAEERVDRPIASPTYTAAALTAGRLASELDGLG